MTWDIGISVYRGEIDSFHRSFHLGALDQDRLTLKEQTACTFMQDKTISTSCTSVAQDDYHFPMASPVLPDKGMVVEPASHRER